VIKIINALLEGIRELGVEAVLLPQQASANGPRVELYFTGIEPAGIDRRNQKAGNLGWEKITFRAELKGGGTHVRWVTDIILASRKLVPLEENAMRLAVAVDVGGAVPETHLFYALWKRLAPGRFEYPDEEESSMPVRYIESWEVSIAYPAQIIGQGPEEEL